MEISADVYLEEIRVSNAVLNLFGVPSRIFRMLVACFYITPKNRGYGDVVPETFLGKMIGASSMIVGIIVLALPISVISTTFGDVWHEWKEELRLDAKSKEEDMKSVELALQVIQNRTFMHVEIYDHFERYPAELLGQTEWKSLPIDSKEKVEVADASYSLHPFLGSLGTGAFGMVKLNCVIV